jgi:hypothetical protein
MLRSCLILFLLTGCAYHYAFYENSYSLHVPYVTGDEKGILTNEIIRALSSGSTHAYLNEDQAQILLKIEIVEKNYNTIGFQQVMAKDQPKKSLVPIEERTFLKAKVHLENKQGCPLIDPYYISAYYDYDFVQQDDYNDLSFVNNEGIRETVLKFSLGELESLPSAQEAAVVPLYRKLAQKIIDSLPQEIGHE